MSDQRRAYNRAHYAQQKKMNDAVKRFAELYPERFAELLIQAKATPFKVEERQVIRVTPIAIELPELYKNRQLPLIADELDAIAYDPQERHIWLKTSDSHLLFKGIKYPSTPQEIVQQFPSTITFQWCDCPACLKRHPTS